MSQPEISSFSGFARLAGYKPSYVTQLKREGRIVLTEDGKAVRVAESLERIRATKDPARQDVAQRHAAARAETAPAGEDEAGEDADLLPGVETPAMTAYQDSRAIKEHYLAMKEKRDYEQSMGRLLDAEEVTAVVSDAITTLRTRLETMPDVYAAQLAAETDEASIRATLADAIQHALDETSRQLAGLGREVAA